MIRPACKNEELRYAGFVRLFVIWYRLLFQKNEMEASYVELQLAHEKQQKMLQMAQVGAPLTHLPTRHLLVQSHQ